MPIRSLNATSEVLPAGGLISRLCNYTLASYSAAGVTGPADGDIVAFTTTDFRVVLAADNSAGDAGLGRVKGAPNTTDLTVNVEWFNVYAFVDLPVANLANITLLDSCIKNGTTTTVADFDAGATTGNLIAVSTYGATTGAGTVCAAVMITGK